MEILWEFGRRRIGDDYFIAFAHYFRKQNKYHLNIYMIDRSKDLLEHIKRKTL